MGIFRTHLWVRCRCRGGLGLKVVYFFCIVFGCNFSFSFLFVWFVPLLTIFYSFVKPVRLVMSEPPMLSLYHTKFEWLSIK